MGKKQSKKEVWLFLPAALLWAAGFVVGALFDLPINEAVYSPASPLAVFMEAFGWYPLLLPLVLLGLYYATAPAGGAPWPGARRGAGAFVAALVLVVLYLYAYRKLVYRGWTNGTGDVRTWLWLAGGLAAAAALAWALYRVGETARRRIWFVGVVGTLLAAENLVVITLLKTLWQRTRFDDMLASGGFGAFTPWYRPFGGGGSSFPSGHVANAASVLLLVALCDVWPRLARHRFWAYAVSWAYIALMAVSRVVIGRHFVSDTFAAAGIMALLFYALRRTKWYRGTCEGVREKSNTGPGGPPEP